MTISRPVLDALGDQSARASLMLADRRHRRCTGREVCQHCDESWPCDARRLADALSAMIGHADALAEHAALDCAALRRVWHLTRRWDQRARSTSGLGTGWPVLAGYAQTVRNAITDGPS